MEIPSKTSKSKVIELDETETTIYNLIFERPITSRELSDISVTDMKKTKNVIHRFIYHGVVERIDLYSDIYAKKMAHWKLIDKLYKEEDYYSRADLNSYFDNSFHFKTKDE